MIHTIRALKKKLASKDRSFWLSFGLHALIIILLIVSIPHATKDFQISGPNQVHIVNATFIAPSQSAVPQNIPVPPPPAPAPKPTPKPAPLAPAPKPVTPAPQPKPVPQPKPAPKAAPLKTPVLQSKQADIQKPVSTQKKVKPLQQPLKKTAVQTKAAAQKAAALKKQQAAAALKAMALSSIQSSIQSEQQQQEAAAAQQRLVSEKEQYMALIQQTVRANWINQFNPNQNLTATLQINLDEQGNVLSVNLVQSSGNPTFDRQAVLAVKKSSPLPLPQDPSLIKDFLNLTLPFSNQGAS